MSLVNYASREINCKIVYYGPGLGGKTTNIKYVYSHIAQDNRGKLMSLATEADRTVFFDFLPMDVGTIRGFHIRFHLYTVPGQVHYNKSRRLILKGVDGLVFVADSQESRLEDNIDSLENLRENLAAEGRDLHQIPLVFQYNKRDLSPVSPVEVLERELNSNGLASFEAVATEGIGVFETFKEMSKMILKTLYE